DLEISTVLDMFLAEEHASLQQATASLAYITQKTTILSTSRGTAKSANFRFQAEKANDFNGRALKTQPRLFKISKSSSVDAAGVLGWSQSGDLFTHNWQTSDTRPSARSFIVNL
ncbi:MAG: hypothetical protein OEU92_24250, partial [Alphaproteobacteria bacterium]|nr:hypothetical protein [Alphaproteobacteria bacterium]